ncbi:MAG: SUMF1/EgtB/PvdO family nonheme iron enzyme, partial [Chloroflexota bacterium]
VRIYTVHLHSPHDDFQSRLESLHILHWKLLHNQNRQPVHNVNLPEFRIDYVEVSNAEYVNFLNEIGNHREGCEGELCIFLQSAKNSSKISLTNNDYVVEAGWEEHPVVEVTWFGAHSYCTWHNTRLPSEAEWEKAARSDDARHFPWGNNFDGSRVNYCDDECTEEWKDEKFNDGYSTTSPVSSFPQGASPYGILNMSGNVLEWVNDWYDEAAYSKSLNLEHYEPPVGEYKVIRGGSWKNDESILATHFRTWFHPNDSASNLGFRCASSN